MKADQSVLKMRKGALEQSKSLPQEGRRLQEKLESLVRTYSSCVDAGTDFSIEEALRVFEEPFADAIAEAQEWGHRDISARLVISLGVTLHGREELQKLSDELNEE